MKTQIQKQGTLIITLMLIFLQTSFSQFTQALVAPAGHTIGTLTAIGIGTFPNAAAILSALHIDGNLTATTTGEVFRTDAPGSSITGPTTYWRMYSGGNEKFNINCNPVTGSIALKMSAMVEMRLGTFAGINSAVRIYTNDQERIHINEAVANKVGFVGIGPGFGGPQSLLHVNGAATDDAYIQLTDGTTTGNAAGNGFKVGIDGATGNAKINQQGAKTIDFLTSGSQRMTILSGGNVGINATSPGNKLEITQGTSGNSGLRFTNLTSANGSSGTSSKFLTVDGSGDVILGDGPGGGLVNSCGGSLAGQTNYISKITGTNEICSSAIYENSTNDHDVGIGGTGSISNSRLFVQADAVSTNSGAPVVNAIYARQISTQTSNADQFAVQAENTAVRSGNYHNFAGYFYSTGTIGNNSLNTAVRGEAVGGATTDYVNGGRFSADNGINNYGVYSSAAGGSLNYAVYGTASIGTCSTGGACYDAAGFFSGALACSAGPYTPSDQFLKTNIQPLTNAMDAINRLEVKSFDYDPQAAPNLNLPLGTQYGLIAEEAEVVLPVTIKEFKVPATIDAQGNIINPEVSYKGVNYTAIIPFLIGGLKEQQLQITALNEQLNNCCTQPRTNGDAGTNKTVVELKSSEPILYQNQPNPFDNSTVIRYFIPANAGDAKILFQDETGRTIKELPLIEKGLGELTINVPDLNSGIYTYSMSLNGKVIDTKKMVKTK